MINHLNLCHDIPKTKLSDEFSIKTIQGNLDDVEGI